MRAEMRLRRREQKGWEVMVRKGNWDVDMIRTYYTHPEVSQLLGLVFNIPVAHKFHFKHGYDGSACVTWLVGEVSSYRSCSAQILLSNILAPLCQAYFENITETFKKRNTSV